VKRGDVQKVKELGSTVDGNKDQKTSSKGRKSWDWKTDPPVTQRQQQIVFQNQKLENQRLMLEEIRAFREMRAKSGRGSNDSS